MTPSTPAARSDSLGLFALSGALLVACLILWFILDPLKYPLFDFAARNTGGARALAEYALALLRPRDFAVFALVAVLLGWVAWIEMRAATLSRALHDAPARAYLFTLCALLLWFGHAYLYPGVLVAGDAGSHVSRTAHLALGLAQGRVVAWDNFFYMGETAMQFTGPLYFWLTAAVDVVLGDPHLTTKLTLLALHFASAAAVYALLRTYGLPRVPVLIGTVAFAGQFAHLHLLIWESALPQSVTLALFPAALLALEHMLRAATRWSRAASAFTVLLAALVINHQSTGIYAGIFLALYALARLVLLGRLRAQAPTFAIAAVLAGGMALFAVLPVLAERQWVMLYDHAGAFLKLVLPTAAELKKLLLWNNGDARGLGGAAYLGIVVVGLAVYAMVAARRDPDRARARLILLLAAAALLTLFLRGAHVRYIVLTVTFIAVLAAFGADYWLNRRRSTRWPAALVALLLLDLGPTAIQPLMRTDKSHFDTAGRYLAEHARAERVLVTNSYTGELAAHIGPGGPPLLAYPVQLMYGAHNLAATLAHNYLASAIKLVESDLNSSGALSPETRAVLALYNVGHIINDTGKNFGLPQRISATRDEPPLGRTIALAPTSPAIFAPALHAEIPPAGFDKPVIWNENFNSDEYPLRARAISEYLRHVVAGMGLDTGHASAATLPVRALPDNTASVSTPAGDGWSGAVTNYEVQLDQVSLVVQSDATGYLQLAHAWYPYMRVTHNGREIPALQGTLNHIVVPVVAGANDYHIEYVRSPLRKLVLAVALGTLLLVVALALRRTPITR